MFVYDHFRGDGNWHPRIVDELSLPELFWLPILREAKRIAIAQTSED